MNFRGMTDSAHFCWRQMAERLVQPILRRTVVYLGRKTGMTVTRGGVETPAEWKQRALGDFQAWLADLPEELPEADPADMTACDLHTLLAELAALRQEIKYQNRQQHSTTKAQQDFMQDWRDLADLFRKRTEALDRLEENIRQNCEMRTASYFLDVRDALRRGLAACRQAAAATGLFRRPPKGIDGIVEGYEIALRRFDRALSHLEIQALETVGRAFDPALMQAIDRQFKPGAAPDEVIEELAGGFVRNAQVIRTARVIVNGSQNG